MKKVAFTRAEYNATLPPYRFNPGDVVEIDEDWADQLVRRGIAKAAKSNAKTVQQIRIDARPPVPTAADERAVRRAQLEAELAALRSEDAAMVEPDEDDDDDEAVPAQPPASPKDGGHYSDMVTRGESAPPQGEGAPTASGKRK